MIFSLAFAAHMLGDWVVQTDAQAAAKMQSWRAMAGHILTYHIVMAAFLVWVLDLRALGLVLVISASTHAFLDRRWPIRWLLRHTGSPQFAETTLGVLAADQACHIVILAVTLALI